MIFSLFVFLVGFSCDGKPIFFGVSFCQNYRWVVKVFKWVYQKKKGLLKERFGSMKNILNINMIINILSMHIG